MVIKVNSVDLWGIDGIPIEVEVDIRSGLNHFLVVGLALAAAVRAAGGERLIVPLANGPEAALVQGLAVFGATHLRQVAAALQGGAPLPRMVPARLDETAGEIPESSRLGDYADVHGQ